MFWETREACIPDVFTSNIPLVFPLECAGGPLLVCAVSEYAHLQESHKKASIVFLDKLYAPKRMVCLILLHQIII